MSIKVRIGAPSQIRDKKQEALEKIYQRLLLTFGPQNWWPAKSAYEMMLGAILTQSTSWHNVELAIGRLRHVKALTPQGLLRLTPAKLEQVIRCAGYFRQKAQRLTIYSQWYLERFNGTAQTMFRTPWKQLRLELLDIKGIGPETADAILLYAGKKPLFVSDAYTSRIFQRHYLIKEDRASYQDIQEFVMHRLPKIVSVYNEFHALLVATGKYYCHRRNPKCSLCPLEKFPHTRS